MRKDARDRSKSNIPKMVTHRSLNAWVKTRWKSRQLRQSHKGLVGIREQKVVSLGRAGGRPPTGLRKGVRSTWGRFCTFSSGLPSNQGYEFGRDQAQSPSCSWPRYQSICEQGQSRQWDMKGVYKLLGCDITKFLFSGLMKSLDRFHTSYKTYFTFCCVNVFPTTIKVSVFLGSWGCVLVGISRGSTVERT